MSFDASASDERQAQPADWLVRAVAVGKQYGNRSRAKAELPSSETCAWALRDVSVTIGPGETVGIIGRNGSGKSTFLKMLSGIVLPSAGSIEVRGRVDALLELGSAFDPDLTGRANVDLYVALLGLRGAAASEQAKAIINYAELGEHIERPVYEYSSGMFVRLAFAAQTSYAPHILIVDEALSVGDHFFQQKAFRRIEELVSNGTTLLFVSHDMNIIQRVCNRALYLRAGHLILDGDPQLAIHHYFSEENPNRSVATGANVDSAMASTEIGRSKAGTLLDQPLWKSDEKELPPGRFIAIAVTSATGEPTTSIPMGEKLVIHTLFTAAAVPDSHVILRIRDRVGQWVTSLSSYFLGLPPPNAAPGTAILFRMEVEFRLEAGTYDISAGLGTFTGNSVTSYTDAVEDLGPIEVHFDYETRKAPFLGKFGPQASAQYIIFDR